MASGTFPEARDALMRISEKLMRVGRIASFWRECPNENYQEGIFPLEYSGFDLGIPELRRGGCAKQASHRAPAILKLEFFHNGRGLNPLP